MARDYLFTPLNLFLRVPDPVGLWLYSTSDIFCEGLAETLLSPLCPSTEGLKHTLSCCTRAAGKGCYWWYPSSDEDKSRCCLHRDRHTTIPNGEDNCLVWPETMSKSKNRWASCNHLGMVAVGWHRMTAQGLRLHRKDRHSKASGLHKMQCPLWRLDEGGLQEKETVCRPAKQIVCPSMLVVEALPIPVLSLQAPRYAQEDSDTH